MGMYTELYLACELRNDTPVDIIHDLAMLTDCKVALPGDSDGVMAALSDDKEYRTDAGKALGWPVVGRGSYYFDAQPMGVFRYDEISNAYYLTFVSNIKNYNEEWEQLLTLIEPWLVFYPENEQYGYASHIGHYRYEEDNTPTILYLTVQHGKPKIMFHVIDEPDWEGKPSRETNEWAGKEYVNG